MAKIHFFAKLGPLRSLGVSPTGDPATPGPGVSPPGENLPFETIYQLPTSKPIQDVTLDILLLEGFAFPPYSAASAIQHWPLGGLLGGPRTPHFCIAYACKSTRVKVRV